MCPSTANAMSLSVARLNCAASVVVETESERQRSHDLRPVEADRNRDRHHLQRRRWPAARSRSTRGPRARVESPAAPPIAPGRDIKVARLGEHDTGSAGQHQQARR